MNMMGLGSRMMRFLMKRKGIDSLESLRSQALAQGVEFIACRDVYGYDGHPARRIAGRSYH